MKYRKKPIEIDAFRWTNSNDSKDYPAWFWKSAKEQNLLFPSGERVAIPTPEGIMIANKGDYIIRGVNGELYPCKPDIFEKTYEPVGDD